MVTNVTKWGNSLGVRIPRAIASKAGITEGEPVELVVENHHILIKKIYRLDILLAQVTPENIHSEIDMGPSSGKEAW